MKRFLEDKCAEFEKTYLNDEVEGALFQAFYPSIMKNANENNDLFPEEVWYEAKEQIKHIRSIKSKEIVLSNLRKRLEQRYATFEYDQKIEPRSIEQRRRTASIVMMTIMFHLLCANIDSLDNNPYKSLILALFEDMKSDLDILKLYNEIDIEETKNECKGIFIVQKDYLSPSIDINPAKPLSEEEKINQLNGMSVNERRLLAFTEAINRIQKKPIDSSKGYTQLRKIQEWGVIQRYAFVYKFIDKENNNSQFIKLLESQPIDYIVPKPKTENLSKYCNILDIQATQEKPKLSKKEGASETKYRQARRIWNTFNKYYKENLDKQEELLAANQKD